MLSLEYWFWFIDCSIFCFHLGFVHNLCIQHTFICILVSYLPDSLLLSVILLLVFICIVIISVVIWCYDLLLSSSIGLLPLQLNSALVLSFIIFIITEIVLFISLFVYHFNIRFYISYIHYISYPLFLLSSIYSFGFPFSNVLILLYSSFPLQCSIIYIKSGMRYHTIDSLSQSIQSGYLFLILQFIEFITSLSSIFDSSIYSIFYFITSIHGFHVGFGVNVWFYYLFYHSSYQYKQYQSLSLYYHHNINLLYIEFHSTIILWSSYWHFIDCIWLLIFQLLY